MTNSSVHLGVCHDFYIGKPPYVLHNSTAIRLDIIEVVNFVPSAFFILWLLITLPFSVMRFCKAKNSQLGIVAYFALVWATAFFRGARFVVLWAFMHGDAPSHLTITEDIMYMAYLTCALTVEASFLLLFVNGVFGNPKWLDRRVLIQSACLFVVILTSQLLLTFVGKYSLLEDDDARNSPFWFATEAAFTLAYGFVILFKYMSCSRQRFPPGPLIITYLAILMGIHGVTAIAQLMIFLRARNAFCPLIVGNVAYYYLVSPLLYSTFLGAYLHPRFCAFLTCCSKSTGYGSLPGDDSLYEYQPVDVLPTSKNWIPPSQLSFSSPYSKNLSGYLSSASLSETEYHTESFSRTTGGSEYDYFDNTRDTSVN